MSYTVPPTELPKRTPPATVTAASWLLYLVGALQLVSVAVVLSTLGTQRRVYEQLYVDTDETLRSAAVLGVTLGLVGAAFGALIFAVGYVALGVLNGRGLNPARIVTWVIASIGVCYFGFGTVGNALSGMVEDIGGGPAVGGEGVPDPVDVQRAVEEALPSWYDTATIAVSATSLVCVLLVIVLLALPASNRYFRRPEPVYEPPPGYPPMA